MNRPYSLDWVRLASGAFYETIVPMTFYEIIILWVGSNSTCLIFLLGKRIREKI
jgi:hypothetical protein